MDGLDAGLPIVAGLSLALDGPEAKCGKCSIGYNGVWRDPGVRLTRPLKRVGPKGRDRFEPTSWDEAIGDIANRLNTIRGRDGAAAILQTHYTGTCSLIAGNFHRN